jgi:hypothetical protein
MPTPPPERDANALRWQLLRDLGAFVVKVALEAFRDLLLIPVGLVAGLAGLVLSPNDPARFFRQVLQLGARFDDFVDLFGTAREAALPAPRTRRVDDLVDGLEAVLREQHERGGVTATAKDAIDRALDAAGEALGDRREPPSGEALGDRREPPSGEA